MARRAHDYHQTIIGDCGHVCEAWPLIGHTLSRAKDRAAEVICDTCTRERYGIPDEETMTVWVRIKDVDPDPFAMQAEKPPPRKRATKTTKKKEPSIWAQLMMDDSDGQT